MFCDIKVFCITRHGIFVTYDPTNNIRSAFVMTDYVPFEMGTEFACGQYNVKSRFAVSKHNFTV
jgi:hypothetical protein